MYTSGHLFSGGWGDGRGFMNAGYAPRFGANHNPAAVATARANVPGLYVREAAIQTIDMRTLPYADVLVGSPICREATPAGGNSKARVQEEFDVGEGKVAKPSRWEQTRMTAWEPIRYADVHGPLAYVGENVPGFFTNNPRMFDAWLRVWDALGPHGYHPTIACVNSAHVGVDTPDGVLGPVPQYRDRLVWVMVRKDLGVVPDLRPRPDALCPSCGLVKGIQHWPGVKRGRRIGGYLRRKPVSGRPSTAKQSYYYVCPTPRCHVRVEPVMRGIGEVLDMDVRGHRFGDGRQDRKEFEAYSAAARAQVEEGHRKFGGKPFIVTRRNHGRPTPLNEPIGTVTAQGGAHHYLARPAANLDIDECEYRPLTVVENARTQGFPAHHVFAGSEGDQKLQVGDAVPVTVATWAAQETLKVLPA
ncbi:DNA cytosine methyltransferase [Streptomyces scabiei]|nr:DNA cytosine methyltransferase [Streptomyces scabiei]MDX2576834.1 DNA cytosine methyltransferase [Streptomyces scabiei]MDX3030207.1 DNA cytosine methyltransferase [Streptomyces scabiei]MDX3208780.1 DNA cytosine methyltransferase [Streptomyces scabiei]